LGQAEDVKLLAGGHSLIPLMRLRLAQPSMLVDINGLQSELGYIRRDNGNLRIGALTRHYQIQASNDVQRSLPLLAEVAGEVGDEQVRSMGTIGGVLAHADPAGDYGTLALMLDATIQTNRRSIAARDFFKGLFTSALASDELIVEVSFPVAAGPHKYEKFRRRLSDWAIVAAAAQRMDDGHWRIGITNAAATPVRAQGVEQALASGASPAEAAKQAVQGLDPSSDLRGSATYKLHLAQVLTQRAIEGVG
jgi:carbon-monoxide dehydrogenase medium subunit